MARSVAGSLPVTIRARLDALSAQHGVAVGAIAREVIKAGSRAVTERLRRAARSATRERGATASGRV